MFKSLFASHPPRRVKHKALSDEVSHVALMFVHIVEDLLICHLARNCVKGAEGIRLFLLEKE